MGTGVNPREILKPNARGSDPYDEHSYQEPFSRWEDLVDRKRLGIHLENEIYQRKRDWASEDKKGILKKVRML